MDANAWIALAGLAFVITTTLLSLIAGAAWKVSRTVTAIEVDVKLTKADVQYSKGKVDSMQATLSNTASKLSEHVEDCDRDRLELRAKLGESV